LSQLNLLFRIATGIALVGWAVIILAPTWEYANTVVWRLVITNLGLLYLYLVFFARIPGIEKTRGSFMTLDGIIALFKNPKALLGAWVHILAFDLVAALYIKTDAAQHAIDHLWLVPVYLLTLMFGPAGLLAYFILRAILVT
jgi:Domain of unknown function (DUF4281)